MPAHMSMVEQDAECKRRISGTDWMLAPHRFFSCEEGSYED